MKRITIGFLLCLYAAIAASPRSAAAVRPPIVEAAKSGDKVTLRALLQKGANVNAGEGDGTTALHWAAYRDDLEAVEMLLKAGAKVNSANDLGATPLWAAAQNGSEAIVRRLLAAGANPNSKLELGETVLMTAARSGYAGIVEQLTARGADVNVKAARSQTALMWAVAQQHVDVVKVLLAHGADIQARTDSWTDMMAVAPHGYLGYNKAIPHGSDTALLFAARAGDLAAAKLLVAAGANVNDADAWGVSATELAAHSGFTDIVEFLLDKGADAKGGKAGFSGLHIAIMRRDERMLSALLAHAADPNAPLQTWTPTRRSSHDFNFEPELIGATPYWIAARFTAPNLMRLLVKSGADPKFVHHAERVTDRYPFQARKETLTPLMAAVGMGGGGASWVEIDRSQREALTLATVKMVMESGVDVNAVNNDGRTALDAARALKFESVIAYLQEKGAKPGTAPQPAGRGAR